MTTLSEAAQQALEALEAVDGPITALLGDLLGSPDTDAPGAKVRAAITALRAALAREQPQLTIDRAAMLREMEAKIAALAQEQVEDEYIPAWKRRGVWDV